MYFFKSMYVSVLYCCLIHSEAPRFQTALWTKPSALISSLVHDDHSTNLESPQLLLVVELRADEFWPFTCYFKKVRFSKSRRCNWGGLILKIGWCDFDNFFCSRWTRHAPIDCKNYYENRTSQSWELASPKDFSVHEKHVKWYSLHTYAPLRRN